MARIPTLRHVPHRAKAKWSQAWVHCLASIVPLNNMAAWSDLLMLPKAVLCVPQGSTKEAATAAFEVNPPLSVASLLASPGGASQSYTSVADEDGARLEGRAATLLNLLHHGALSKDLDASVAKPAKVAAEVLATLSKAVEHEEETADLPQERGE